MLTGQRAFLTAVATSAGRVLAVPVAQVRRVMAQEPGLSDLILRTFLLRHSLLLSRGTGLTLIGSRFDPDTRRLLEVLARNRLVWTLSRSKVVNRSWWRLVATKLVRVPSWAGWRGGYGGRGAGGVRECAARPPCRAAAFSA
jgi:hypothetical protein